MVRLLPNVVVLGHIAVHGFNPTMVRLLLDREGRW